VFEATEVKQILAECYSKTAKFKEADKVFKELLKARHEVVLRERSIHAVDNAL